MKIEYFNKVDDTINNLFWDKQITSSRSKLHCINNGVINVLCVTNGYCARAYFEIVAVCCQLTNKFEITGNNNLYNLRGALITNALADGPRENTFDLALMRTI